MQPIHLTAHVPQVRDVGGQRFREGVQMYVLDAVLLAHLLDDRGDGGVVVLHGEKMKK